MGISIHARQTDNSLTEKMPTMSLRPVLSTNHVEIAVAIT